MTIRKDNITAALLACALTMACASDRSAAREPMAAAEAAPAAVAAEVTQETAPAPAPTTYSDTTRYLGTSNPPQGAATGSSTPAPATAALPASSVRSTVTGTVLNPAGAVVKEEAAIGATPAAVAAGTAAATAPAGSRGVSTTSAVSVDLATAASASQPTSIAGTTAPTRAERSASVAAPTAAALPVSQPASTAAAITTTTQAATAISSTGGLNRSGGSGAVRVTESPSGTIAITNAPATKPPARRSLRQRLRDLVRRGPAKQ